MNIDATQGDECDIAIPSTSIGSGKIDDHGHCEDIKCRTVLFSRAKFRQCVIADTCEHDPDWNREEISSHIVAENTLPITV